MNINNQVCLPGLVEFLNPLPSFQLNKKFCPDFASVEVDGDASLRAVGICALFRSQGLALKYFKLHRLILPVLVDHANTTGLNHCFCKPPGFFFLGITPSGLFFVVK